MLKAQSSTIRILFFDGYSILSVFFVLNKVEAKGVLALCSSSPTESAAEEFNMLTSAYGLISHGFHSYTIAKLFALYLHKYIFSFFPFSSISCFEKIQKLKEKQLPWSSSGCGIEVKLICPLNQRTIPSEMTSPSPIPFTLQCYVLQMKPNSLNSLSQSAYGMPMPVSRTSITRYFLLSLSSILTLMVTPPFQVNFRAFDYRLRRTCITLFSSMYKMGECLDLLIKSEFRSSSVRAMPSNSAFR